MTMATSAVSAGFVCEYHLPRRAELFGPYSLGSTRINMNVMEPTARLLERHYVFLSGVHYCQAIRGKAHVCLGQTTFRRFLVPSSHVFAFSNKRRLHARKVI